MIIKSDSRHIPLDDKSVNCIITSPPYWSLRKYDIPDLVWDEFKWCEHKVGFGEHLWKDDPVPGEKSGKPGPNATVGARFEQDAIRRRKPTNTCLCCGAWRGQLGLEPTIDLYLKHLMQIMDECWRVLRDDGTMWVNIGDSYSGSGGEHKPWHKSDSGFQHKGGFSKHSLGDEFTKSKEYSTSPKSLCLIPERFAIEMVNRGWILRNKIIWHKPNCMPASVKDRFTVDFEPVFFFVKSRKYWFDIESVREPLSDASVKRIMEPTFDDQRGGPKDYGHLTNTNMSARKALCNLKERYIKQEKWGDRFEGWKERDKSIGRNKRCVWTIPTQPYPESHFATFPEALIEPMIRAGCPKEICMKCGKGREKIINTEYDWQTKGKARGKKQSSGQMATIPGHAIKRVSEIGFTDCGCKAGWEQGIVFDPFCGSGTVIKVAEKLQRKAIGIDLGYQELSEKRTENNQVELFV